jgi:hypothetical protein
VVEQLKIFVALLRLFLHVRQRPLPGAEGIHGVAQDRGRSQRRSRA